MENEGSVFHMPPRHRRKYKHDIEPRCHTYCVMVRDAQVQARQQLMEVVRRWQTSGRSVNELLHLMMNERLTYNPKEP